MVTTFLSWRAGFVIELIVILFVLLMSRRISEFPTKLEKSDFDLAGSALVIIGLILLVLGIINISEGGASLGLIAAGIAILIVFAICESRRKKAGKIPLIDLAIARERNLSLGTAMGTAIIGTILIVEAVGGLHDSINLYYPDEITND